LKHNLLTYLIKGSDADIQEHVLQRFQELLCADREGYDERLDFYEIRFNAAVAKVRLSARKQVGIYESRRESLAYDGDTVTVSGDMEEALARLKNADSGSEIDFLYRSKLHAAIKSLGPDERRVVELLLQDMAIDSKDDEAVTIVKILGCSEKTVRNRRDRAFATIREALKDEEVA
jgi:DNA-directed RNA polymerase specialized sigma24 family protein